LDLYADALYTAVMPNNQDDATLTATPHRTATSSPTKQSRPSSIKTPQPNCDPRFSKMRTINWNKQHFIPHINLLHLCPPDNPHHQNPLPQIPSKNPTSQLRSQNGQQQPLQQADKIKRGALALFLALLASVLPRSNPLFPSPSITNRLTLRSTPPTRTPM
jgi:hypothetical protein